MAAANNISLINVETINSDTTTLSSVKSIGNKATEFIMTSEVSNRTDGTFTSSLEHSPDGISWFPLDSCTAQSVNGMVIKQISVNAFQNIRASILSASVTSGAQISIKLWFALRD